MEPTPPKAQRSRKCINRPFYESTKKTSAEIISEARSNVRTVETNRPYTPIEPARTLFSKHGQSREGRPPSACSIASSYTESRPPTGKRLTPLNSTPDFTELESRLQQLGNNDGPSSIPFDEENNNTVINEQKPVFKNSIIPNSLEPTFSKSRMSRGKRIMSPKVSQNEPRRVHSGPKERTQVAVKNDTDNTLQRSSSFGDVSSNHNDNNINPNCNKNNNNTRKKETFASKNLSSESLATDTTSLFFEDNVRPLLKQMELNELHEDIDSLSTNFDILLKTLEIGNLLGKSTIGSKRRSELLSVVYKCVKSNNAVLQLKLCRLFLAFEVSGKNLEVVCKLLFQVSRNKKNDEEFLQEKLIEPIVQLVTTPSKLSVIESLVYLTGTIKFLTLNKQCLQELIKSNALNALSSLLRFTKKKLSNNAVNNKESCHMLVQVTSALSNFANVTTLIENFIENDTLQLLLDLMKTRLDDVDYVMNVSRVFSKMTVSETICNNIMKKKSNVGILMNALVTHMKKQEIVVRLCFVFGNMANHVSESRNELITCCDGKKVFVNVAEYYIQQLTKKLPKREGAKLSDEEDVLIKCVRVIANVSIDGECGNEYANNEDCVRVLLKILGVSSMTLVLELKDIELKLFVALRLVFTEESHASLKLYDELVINTSATINNLSFYATPDSSLISHGERLSSVFLQLLLSENQECASEAMRALGNFTQDAHIREYLVEQNVLELTITLLDSCDREMIYCACGVLVNLMVDEQNRILVKEMQGISKLISILKEVGEVDWCLLALICQVLWNYSENITTSMDCFGDDETDDLMTLLNEYLEPELALDYDNNNDGGEMGDDTIEYLMETWEQQFQPVAALLLQRVERHHTNLEPLTAAPD